MYTGQLNRFVKPLTLSLECICHAVLIMPGVQEFSKFNLSVAGYSIDIKYKQKWNNTSSS